MRRLGVLCLLLCALAGTLILLRCKKAETAAREKRACLSVDTDEIPSWVTSGVWLDDSLLLADVSQRRLVRVSKDGEAGRFGLEIGDELSGPIRIKANAPPAPSTAGFVIELADGRLLPVDQSFRKRRDSPLLLATLENEGRHIAALLDWVPAGEDIVGYADIDGTTGLVSGWTNGIVRFSLAKPEAFIVAHERPFPDAMRVSMRLTYPLIASIGSTGYVVLMDERMGLWRLGPDDRDLQAMVAFPPSLRTRPAPKLPGWLQREEYPEVMAAVEKAAMPAGLWAWERSLFLLSRAFEGGQRHWYLSRIDPVRDEVLWTVPVPSTAHHMTVIPGPDRWALLEKGPVLGWLNQETDSILFIKSSQMRSSRLQALCP